MKWIAKPLPINKLQRIQPFCLNKARRFKIQFSVSFILLSISILNKPLTHITGRVRKYSYIKIFALANLLEKVTVYFHN